MDYLLCDVFQHDGAPFHQVKKVKQWLTENNYNTLQVSANSPDLNPIENFWRNVKVNMFGIQPHSLEDLLRFIEHVWEYDWEIPQCFEQINEDPDCRCVVLSGVGKTFCSGIDLNLFGQILSEVKTEDVGRRSFFLRRLILNYQHSFTAIEKCLKPVITAIHGSCIGAGFAMICAADIRLATKDSWFQIKEGALGFASDIGTLQRLPKLVGSDSLARELVYTTRKMLVDEALKCGFISNMFDDKESALKYAFETAVQISTLSPVGIQSSKAAMVYSRDHSVEDGLLMQAHWNQAMLQSEDLVKSVMAAVSKDIPEYDNL